MSKFRWFFRAFLGLAALLNSALGQPVNRVTTAIGNRGAVVRHGDLHPLARTEFDVGAAPNDLRMDRMILVLQPDAGQRQELEDLIAAQNDPESPEYRRWLTPESFGERFGISQNDVDQIVTWLESAGFEVEPVPPSRRTIVFSGTAAMVEAAFQTKIHLYSVQGSRHYANASPPRIPRALADVVEGIASLHDFRTTPMHVGLSAAQIPSPDWTASNGSHLLAPGDFATIYNLSPLFANATDGTGQSIAIIGRTNINISDVQRFRSTFGLPANDPTVILNGRDPGIVSEDEQGEAVLDVEWSGAAAPKAAIKLIVSASTQSTDGVVLSAQYAVNRNIAPVVSVSFGACELSMGASGNQLWNSLWQQAAAQGMTVLVASGDSGVAGCDGPSSAKASYGHNINGLCSSPYSTCVGGTQFNDTANPGLYWTAKNSATLASALTYIPEAAWNQSGSVSGGSGLWGTGGGSSVIYTKPVWQTGPGVPADGWRDVPDVSLTASMHDGYLMYMNNSTYSVGGTSASAPAFAGLMAMAVQRIGSRLGNVNPTLYGFASRQANNGAAVFHDVAAGNNSVPGLAGYTAGPGYDLATGLGSVDAAMLINHWNDPAAPTFQVGATPASYTVRVGASATGAISLTRSGGFKSSVVLSATGLPAGVTASFAPASMNADSTSSTVTINATAQAKAGVYTIQVVAKSENIERSLSIPLTISAACNYSLTPTSASVTAAATTNTVQVTAVAGCSWTAVTTATWIAITGGGAGTATGNVTYSVAANNGSTARSGVLTIVGLSFTVNQAAMAFVLSSNSASVSAAASTGTVSVSATPSTATWTATSNASWITITGGASGKGSQNVTYSIAANTTPTARSGSMTIAGLTYTVTQSGMPCTYTVSPLNAAVGSAAGSYTVEVKAPSACTWTAKSNSTFLAIVASANGAGNGIVSYAATANTAAPRSGTLTVANATVSVSQSAPPPVTATFSMTPGSADYNAAGGGGTVAVASNVATAAWTAVSNASWISITKGAAGKGSDTVAYTVAANSAKTSRTGTMTIAGLTFKVNQAALACSYIVGTGTVTTSLSSGFTISFPVATSAGCAWSATSSATWLAVSTGAGNGNGSAVFQAARNTTGTSRTGNVAIAGVTVLITQSK